MIQREFSGICMPPDAVDPLKAEARKGTDKGVLI
jgi:hypothetical protein